MVNGTTRTTTIPLELLVDSSFNPRKFVDKEDLAELKRSIGIRGVLIPLIARVLDKGHWKYQVVCGRRRLRAALDLGKTGTDEEKKRVEVLPVQVMDLTDEEARELQLVENIQRANMHYLDEGAAFQELRKRKYSLEDIAAKVGKTTNFIARRLALVGLSPKLHSMAEEGNLPERVAFLLAPLPHREQDKTAGECSNKYTDGKQRLVSWQHLERIKEHLSRNAFRNLKQAPWDLIDPDLLKAAGPCMACPKRTGMNAMLFDGLGDFTCTDGACFAAKEQAFVTAQVNAAESKGKTLVKLNVTYHPIERKGVLNRDSFLVLPSGDTCESMSTGIVTLTGWEREYHVGKLLTICADSKCKKHHGRGSSQGSYRQSDSALSTQRAERRKNELASLVRTRQLNYFCKEFSDLGRPLTPNHLRRLALAFSEKFGHDLAKEVARAMGATKEQLRDPRAYVEKAVKAWTDIGLPALLLRLTFADCLFVRFSQTEDVKRMLEAAKDEGFEADMDKIENQAATELKVKWDKVDARWKKPKTDAQKAKAPKRANPDDSKKGSGPPSDAKQRKSAKPKGKRGKKWYL